MIIERAKEWYANNICPLGYEAHNLVGELISEVERLEEDRNRWRNNAATVEKELSRYQSGVEVEGY